METNNEQKYHHLEIKIDNPKINDPIDFFDGFDDKKAITGIIIKISEALKEGNYNLVIEEL